MGKRLSMAFYSGKHSLNKPNFLSPSKKLSKKPQTHHTPSMSFRLDDRNKAVQECRSEGPAIPKTGPTGVELLRVHTLVEKPVMFNFGDDYGNHLFLESRKELSFERSNYGRRLFDDAVVEMDNCSDDVYTFSPEEDMIISFWKENLL